MSDFGLPQRTTDTMHAIFAKHSGVKKVTVYGSRAMGNYRNGSDIDLTMFGDALGYEDVSRIAGELDDSDIPYLVDLSIFDRLDDAEFKDHIRRRGKVFYDRHAGWRTVKLGDVCEIRPQKSEVKKKLDGDAQVSFMGMNILGIDKKYAESKVTKTLSAVYKSYTYFADNDVLLAKITPCFENGKLGIARGLTNGVGFGSSEFVVYRCHGDVLPDFLYYCLRNPKFRTTGMKKMSGTVGQKRVKMDYLTSALIPLPPLPEQKRIVAKLDAAFAEIDKAIVAVENSKDHLNCILKNTLTTMLNEPSGWKNSRLDQLCTNLDSKRIPITKSKRKEGSMPYYGASGVVDYVKDWLFDEDILLVSEDGANLLMRTYPIAFSVSGKCWVNNHAHVLKFTNRDIQSWVEIYLNSIDLSDRISGMAQPKLNQKKLNSTPIPLPSTEKLTEVLNRVKSITGHLDTYRKLNEGKVANYHTLKSALLAQELQNEVV